MDDEREEMQCMRDARRDANASSEYAILRQLTHEAKNEQFLSTGAELNLYTIYNVVRPIVLISLYCTALAVFIYISICNKSCLLYLRQ